MKAFLAKHELILMEGAVVERLRRSPQIQLHPTLVNATLIYEAAGRAALWKIYRSYIEIAKKAGLPIFLGTPTWRSNRDRVAAAGVAPTINRDAAGFMQELRKTYVDFQQQIKIGGILGCKNDCYRPEEGLSAEAAADFHAWQIEELVAGGVDFLIAETLPHVEEARGIAQALSTTGLPYFLSFVIGRNGRILDQTPLDEAIATLDQSLATPPTAYLVNCAYPSFLHSSDQAPALFQRLIGYLANGSALDQCDLDGATDLHQEPVEDWSTAMMDLHEKHGMKILGGCCGTGEEHLTALTTAHSLRLSN